MGECNQGAISGERSKMVPITCHCHVPSRRPCPVCPHPQLCLFCPPHPHMGERECRRPPQGAQDPWSARVCLFALCLNGYSNFLSKGNKATLILRILEHEKSTTLDALREPPVARKMSTAPAGVAPGIPPVSQTSDGQAQGFLNVTLPDLWVPVREPPVQIVRPSAFSLSVCSSPPQAVCPRLLGLVVSATAPASPRSPPKTQCRRRRRHPPQRRPVPQPPRRKRRRPRKSPVPSPSQAHRRRRHSRRHHRRPGAASTPTDQIRFLENIFLMYLVVSRPSI